MLSRRRYKRRREVSDADIVAGELDTPASLEPAWDIYRLGKKEEHLWMAQLATPLPVTTDSVAHNYEMDFNFTLTRMTFYQTDDADAEDEMPLTFRVNLLNPNKTPAVLYHEVSVIWVAGELTLTGKRYSPSAEIQFVLNGCLGNLVHVNMEFEVHGIA